jgi:hypothetical protein
MMLVVNRYVDVLNPRTIKGVVCYRSFDRATNDWGTLHKSHSRPFDSVEEAREWVNLHLIGSEE